MLETPKAEHKLLTQLVQNARFNDAETCAKASMLLHKLRPRGLQLTVSVCVQHVDGSLLCVTRKIDKDLPLNERRVCLPGGHVEPEDFQASQGLATMFEHCLSNAARRELKEETGLDAPFLTHCFMDLDDADMLCVMHRCSWQSCRGELRPEPDTEVLWLSGDEMVRRSSWPGYYARAREAGVF